MQEKNQTERMDASKYIEKKSKLALTKFLLKVKKYPYIITHLHM